MMSVTARVADKGISLVLSDDVLDVILSESYNPVCIASFFQNKEHSFLMRFDKTNIACFLADVWWPIERWVEKNIVTVISKMLVTEEAIEGSTISIFAANDSKGLKYQLMNKMDMTDMV
jgi:ATP-dependent Clp protease ATP-binding subunit ClpB